MNLKQILYAVTIVGSIALSIQAYETEEPDENLSTQQKRELMAKLAVGVRELPDGPERTSLAERFKKLKLLLSPEKPSRCSSWFGCCKRTPK